THFVALIRTTATHSEKEKSLEAGVDGRLNTEHATRLLGRYSSYTAITKSNPSVSHFLNRISFLHLYSLSGGCNPTNVALGLWRIVRGIISWYYILIVYGNSCMQYHFGYLSYNSLCH